MTEQQEQLTKIIQRRTKFMNKKWEIARCNFDFTTFVEVSFVNSDSDFRTTRYPSLEEAIEQQTTKLKRDVKKKFDEGKDLTPLMNFLLA